LQVRKQQLFTTPMAPWKRSDTNALAAAAHKKTIDAKAASSLTCEECAICFEPLTEEGAKTKLRCRHEFHDACVEGVRKSKQAQACPLCRDPLPPTKEQIERAKCIALHMTLLNHATVCAAATCPSGNCGEMKSLLVHAQTCTVTSGCITCRRVLALLSLHSRACTLTVCRVPLCDHFRQRHGRPQAAGAAP